jgi:hypothetical protein
LDGISEGLQDLSLRFAGKETKIDSGNRCINFSITKMI